MGLGGLLAQPAAAAAPWTAKPAANSFGAGRQDYRYTLDPGGALEDGIVVRNPGTTALHLDLASKEARSTGIGAWVRPGRDDVIVPPGESVEVPFAITLPDGAAPGDYVGGIAGVPIRLRVGGALEPRLAVEGVQLDYSGTADPLGKGDATVTYTIHNTGNAILSARQSVSIAGPFGRWTVAAGKIPDALSLLPGATRKVSAPVRDVTPRSG
jgi:uncharacterized membrane protein